jgi:hypothetical protein
LRFSLLPEFSKKPASPQTVATFYSGNSCDAQRPRMGLRPGYQIRVLSAKLCRRAAISSAIFLSTTKMNIQ